MSRKIPEHLRREFQETFRPADVRWLPGVKLEARQPPPVGSGAFVGARELIIAAAALGGGYLIGRWLRRRKPAGAPMLRLVPSESLPDWVVT